MILASPTNATSNETFKQKVRLASICYAAMTTMMARVVLPASTFGLFLPPCSYVLTSTLKQIWIEAQSMRSKKNLAVASCTPGFLGSYCGFSLYTRRFPIDLNSRYLIFQQYQNCRSCFSYSYCVQHMVLLKVFVRPRLVILARLVRYI